MPNHYSKDKPSDSIKRANAAIARAKKIINSPKGMAVANQSKGMPFTSKSNRAYQASTLNKK